MWLCPRCDVEGFWTIRTDGTQAVQITDEETGSAWSPDGKELVLETGGGLSVFTATGAAGREVVARGSQPAWQPVPRGGDTLHA